MRRSALKRRIEKYRRMRTAFTLSVLIHAALFLGIWHAAP